MCDARPDYLVTVTMKFTFGHYYRRLGFHEWIYWLEGRFLKKKVQPDFTNWPYFFFFKNHFFETNTSPK